MSLFSQRETLVLLFVHLTLSKSPSWRYSHCNLTVYLATQPDICHTKWLIIAVSLAEVTPLLNNLLTTMFKQYEKWVHSQV